MKVKDIDNTMYPSKIANHIVKEQNKELERLNNIIDKQDRDITTLTKDKIKLKNMFDELKKWLDAISYMYEEEYKDINASEHYKCVLNKITQMFGGNKNV